MSLNVPALIQTFWSSQAGLPDLWLEYGPEPFLPPFAVLEATGFSRDYLSAGMKQDSHNYKISVLTTSAESTWTLGELATASMESLSDTKIIAVRIEPDNLARPAKIGQLDVWIFEFSLRVELFDN